MLRLYIVGYTPEIAPAVGARVAQFLSGIKPPASTWSESRRCSTPTS
jgi:hypothetical protein